MYWDSNFIREPSFGQNELAATISPTSLLRIARDAVGVNMKVTVSEKAMIDPDASLQPANEVVNNCVTIPESGM